MPCALVPAHDRRSHCLGCHAAGYLANILSGGLGLRPLPQLAQLEALLACAPSELPAKVRATTALPSALATAIAGKRGVQLS